jgi:hypothetical protein
MVIYKGKPETTHFLNVDLDIYSKADLQPLVAALGKKVMVLYVGRIKQTHSAHLELTKITKSADTTIRGFCSLIETLPRMERDLWNAAKVRDFNIGVQAGTEPLSTEFALATETLRAAHKLGARIIFTIYAAERGRKLAAKGRTRSK